MHTAHIQQIFIAKNGNVPNLNQLASEYTYYVISTFNNVEP